MADAARQPSRFGALDGLRGWASLLVVFTHIFSASLHWYNPPGIEKWQLGSGRWWLVQSPLHILWAGPEMVPVFFILSAYVLTLPALKRGNGWFRWSYYPRRLVRLYPTAWVAIVFAAILHALPAHSPQPGATHWLNIFAVPLTATNTLKSATLLGPVSALYGLTSALWTMRWEVIFSMLLPLVIAAVLTTRRRPVIAVLAAGVCFLCICTTSGNGPFAEKALHYLPMFVLGVLMCIHLPPRDPSAARPARMVPQVPELATSILLILVCVALLTVNYWTVNLDFTATSGWLSAATMAGACMLVWLCRGDQLAVRAMSTRTSRWLGQRCYSLYLVHLPIVLSIAFAFHGRINAIALIAIAVPLSLIGADLLFRLVERPSIGLSHRVGRWTLPSDRRPAVS